MTSVGDILEVRDLKKHYRLAGGPLGIGAESVIALDGVSFTVRRNETFAIVGESGCGKSTLARTILGLERPSGGSVWLNGARIDRLSPRRLRPLRRDIQMVFQDPFSSLNPRLRIRRILGEPLTNFGLASGHDLTRRVEELIELVGLSRQALDRFPHEFSGGQRQRIAIARALAAGGDLLICDEAVAALDVSVKAQIINLLMDLQARLGIALMFVSHDLAIVEHMAHRIAVMYLGKIVELSDGSVFTAPRHPYTQALLASVPSLDPAMRDQAAVPKGDPPSAVHPPGGCRFHPRCPIAQQRCREVEPILRAVAAGVEVACHLA